MWSLYASVLCYMCFGHCGYICTQRFHLKIHSLTQSVDTNASTPISASFEGENYMQIITACASGLIIFYLAMWQYVSGSPAHTIRAIVEHCFFDSFVKIFTESESKARIMDLGLF